MSISKYMKTLDKYLEKLRTTLYQLHRKKVETAGRVVDVDRPQSSSFSNVKVRVARKRATKKIGITFSLRCTKWVWGISHPSNGSFLNENLK